MAAACVGFTDMEGAPTRQAGRAVWARLWAAAQKATWPMTAAPGNCRVDEAAYRAGAKKLANALLTHPVTSQALPGVQGTDVLVNILSEAGGLAYAQFQRRTL